ncbi:hypothetical protein V5E97_00125 [Singulisphaera sp. Ch08]|uniref:Uncharacterized protein n=1 Tax=Singulisphaera sp. Ch08 TaxID=3120278 RepID=A0AAU7CGR7_9BACT
MNGKLPCGLDELEDAIDSALGDRGEVTGTGTGQVGSNIDVFIEEGDLSKAQALQLIRRILVDYGLPAATKIVVDGCEHSLA